MAVAALAAVFFPIGSSSPVPEIGNVAFILGSLTLVAMPLAIAVAILRYRLYDIDRIVSRTISYGVITALLVAVFLVVNVGLQAALSSVTSSNAWAVAGSTLLAAALFTPVRLRVQHVVDRRFDRARYDADRLTIEFGDRLRDEVDLSTLGDELDATVRRAFAPTGVGLWLRGGAREGFVVELGSPPCVTRASKDRSTVTFPERRPTNMRIEMSELTHPIRRLLGRNDRAVPTPAVATPRGPIAPATAPVTDAARSPSRSTSRNWTR